MTTAARSGMTVVVEPGTVPSRPAAPPHTGRGFGPRRPSPRVRRTGRIGPPTKTADRRQLLAVVLIAATLGAMNVDTQTTPSSTPDITVPAPAAGGDRQTVDPVPSGRTSSGFGNRPGGMHYGLDIAAPIGTPIRAVADATVIEAGPASGFGLWVRIRHADGTVSVYGHMNTITTRVGNHVAAGEQIATVGNRGQSTGPHLHIEIWLHGDRAQRVNPAVWLRARGVRR